MRQVRTYQFGRVQAYELGWSPVGRPMMSVFVYIVDHVLIDTGQRHMERTVLNILESKKIERVLLTHHHEDHSGNASAIKDQRKIPVLGHPLTVEKMKAPFRIFPYQHYIWGRAAPLEMEALPEVMETGSLALRPIHTPGHSMDHTAYWEPRRGWLFSGDLYLADRVKYFRADEDLGRQISSLKQVLRLDFDALFCGHHPKPAQGKERLGMKLRFLEDILGGVKKLRLSGCGEKEIMHRLGLRESHLVKWFCFGNVSMRNMIRSALKAIDSAECIPEEPIASGGGK